MVNKKVRIQSYISPKLKESIDKYCIKNNKNISVVTNEALLSFFKLKPVDDNLDFIVSIIENTIHKELDSKLERLIGLNARTTKASYSSQILLLNFISYIFNKDIDREFLKEQIKKAEAIGYKATKMPIASSIDEIFPVDFDFKNME